MNKLKIWRAVQELWEAHGPDAHVAATERAEAVGARGRETLARHYLDVAEVCKSLKDLPPRQGDL